MVTDLKGVSCESRTTFPKSFYIHIEFQRSRCVQMHKVIALMNATSLNQ